MKKNVLLFLFLAICITTTQAQRTCQTTTSTYSAEQQKYITGGELFEKELQQTISKLQKRTRLQKEQATYQIPIIVHVVHNGEPIGQGANISAEQIYGQIEVLNEDFSMQNPNKDETIDIFKDRADNPSIEFVLATLDPEGRPLAEKGINRVKGCRSLWLKSTFEAYGMPQSIWNPNRYFNIFTINMSDGDYGFAQFPTLSNLSGLEEEADHIQTCGVSVNYRHFGSVLKTPNVAQLENSAPLDKGRTLTHEVGHFFGVLHTWGDGGCTIDDFCEDTPRTGKSYRGCKLDEPACEQGQVVMVQNFMDYTDDACMSLFTKNQVARMHAVLEISPRRKELLTSDAARELQNEVFASFVPSQNQVFKGREITFQNTSIATGISQITSYQWVFEGGTPNTSTTENPTISYSQTGVFNVTLTVRGQSGESQTINKQISVLDTPTTSFTETIKDFEDRSFFSGGWSILQSGVLDWRLFSKSAFGNAGFSAFASNHTTNGCESDLSLVSPVLQNGQNRVFEVKFDVAHAVRPNRPIDSLEISFATDGGDVFTSVWKKGGQELATSNSTASTAFTPSDNEWQTHSFYIQAPTNSQFIQVKFRNIGANNNQLYLDNLYIRQANDLAPPFVSFEVSYPLVLLSERAKLFSTSQFATTFDWRITGNETIISTVENPQLSFSQTGSYTISLTASNPLGSRMATLNNAIEVMKGNRILNWQDENLIIEKLNNTYLAGHNTTQDQAKAEYFEVSSRYEKIHAIDLFFAELINLNPFASFDVVIWNAENGKPSTELHRQSIPYAQVQKDIERNQFTRVILSQPKDIPSSFFVGIELEYQSGTKFTLFTQKSNEGTGWERITSGEWKPYSESRSQNYSNAIAVLLSPDIPLGNEDDNPTFDVVVYPNPNQGSFEIQAKDTQIEQLEVFNALGQSVLQITQFDESIITLPYYQKGLYLVRIHTKNGVLVKKMVIE